MDSTASSTPAASNDSGFQGNPELNLFGLTNYRNQNRRFGIKTDDRRRHMYIVGKTGMGKTTILENMVLNDIYAGHGIGLVDPHGDFAEKIINYIPPHRINDVVYFNPADINYPIGFNILESINPEYRHLVASGLMGVFKKIWPDVWSARMEYILNNTILALLDFPGTTLLGINRLLADEEYRKRVVGNLKDPVVGAFWQNEFASYSDKFRQEAVAPIQNKIGQFLSASVIRNIVAQVKSRINIREIMDTKKIFIINLSKGRIGEDNSRLLGGMLITKIQLSAMERVDIPEHTRNDFFLYVDEFQNFATESFANILSEARKYRLDLIMAHQYMEQLDEKVLAAVIGNVGTMVTFRVGSSDAEILAKEFTPTFLEEDLVNLPKYHVYLKLMIDGVASRPFSAMTMPPIGSSTGSTEKVVKVSRERYAVSREKIEDKIARWSGMVVMSEEEARALEVSDDEAMFSASAPAVSPPNNETPQFNRPLGTPLVAPSAPTPAIENKVELSAAPAVSLVSLSSGMRPPRSAPPIPNRAPSSGAPSGAGQQLSSSKNRRRRKKKGGGMPAGDSQKVLLVDPGQKGISLTAIAGKSAAAESPMPSRIPRSNENRGQKIASLSSLTNRMVAPKTEPASPAEPAIAAPPLNLGLPVQPQNLDKNQTVTPHSVPVVPSASVPLTPAIPRAEEHPHQPPANPAGTEPAPQPKTISPGAVEKISNER